MLFPERDLAIVTGGGRGIGRAIALDLAAEGARVVVNFVKNESAASQVVDEICAAGGEACARQADVSDEADVRRLFRCVRQELGCPRILVNNAGITDDGLLALMSFEKWNKVVSVNLNSAFLCSREAVRLMARDRKNARGAGSIINIASVAGISGSVGQANYDAAKGGLIAFTRGLAREVASCAVRVNAVAPGFIETDMIRGVPTRLIDRYTEIVPLQRIGQPCEVGGVVSFLASDRASYITGQVIAVDGGFTH